MCCCQSTLILEKTTYFYIFKTTNHTADWQLHMVSFPQFRYFSALYIYRSNILTCHLSKTKQRVMNWSLFSVTQIYFGCYTLVHFSFVPLQSPSPHYAGSLKKCKAALFIAPKVNRNWLDTTHNFGQQWNTLLALQFLSHTLFFFLSQTKLNKIITKGKYIL